MKRKELLLVVLALAIITCAFFYKAVFTDQVLVAADVLGQYLPWKLNLAYPDKPHNPNLSDVVDENYQMKSYTAQLLGKNIIPLWNPLILCGVPYFANSEIAAFSPFHLLFRIFPVSKAYGYISLLQTLLAGLFMYIFMRGIDTRPFGSIVAAVTYMFNSSFIIWMFHLNFVAVALWLPLILFFIEKFLRSNKFIYSIFAGIFIGIQFLCGFAQISLYVIIGALVYTLIRLLQLKRKDISAYLGVILSFLIGFGLGAIQWVSTFELLKLCQRTSYPPSSSFLFDFQAALQLMTTVFPDIFGNPMDYNYWGTPNYSELCSYMGVLPLIFALIALFYRRDKITFAVFAIGLFSLLVYLDSFCLNGLLNRFVPGYSKGIAPNRIICLYLFAGPVLAGLGADYMRPDNQIKKKLRKFPGRLFIAAVTLIVFAISFIFIFRFQGVRVIQIISSLPFCNSWGIAPILEKAFSKVSSISSIPKYYWLSSPAVYLPLSFILAGVLLLKFYLKKGSSGIFKLMALLIIIADLFYFGLHYITTVDKKLIFPKLESIDFLNKDRDLFRVISLGNVFPKNTLTQYNIHIAEGYVCLFPKRYNEFCLAIDETSKIGTPGVGIEFSSAITRSPLINLLNVKYILTSETLNDDRFKLVYDKDILIYENKNVLPRAFIVPKAKVIKNGEDALKELNGGNFNPKEYIILEEAPLMKPVYFSTEGSTVKITDYSPNSVGLEASLTAPGFLLISDTYYPGWKVYVDGKLDKVYCADYTFRAVYLDKGRHRVRFVYKPSSFRIGLNLTMVTLVVLLAGIIMIGMNNRPKER